MSVVLRKYAFFVLAGVWGLCLPQQAATQELEAAEPAAPAEQMLAAAVRDLKEAMGEALRKNTQMGEKNKALRQALERYEQDLAGFQQERDQLLADQKVLREALTLQEEDRDNLLKDLEALRKAGQNHDVNRDDKEVQMSVMLDKQKRLQEEAQLLQEEVSFFQKRLQQKSAQPLQRDKQEEKEALIARCDALRNDIDRRKESVRKLQQKISSQKNRTEELKSQKEAWLPRVAESQGRLSAAEGTLEKFNQQRETAALKDKAALAGLQEDIARLRSDKEQLEKIFADIQDLQEVVRVASRQQEKQAVIFRRVLAEETDLLRRKKQVLSERLPLQDAAAFWTPSPSSASWAVSREQLADDIDDLNLSIRKGQIQTKAYRKKEKLLGKEIAALQADCQRAQKGQGASPSAQEIKEELTRLLEDIDLDEPAEASWVPDEEDNNAPVPVSESQKLKRDVEALQLREAVLTSSLSIIEARYEEERKAAESFSREETQLNDYLKVLQRENQGLQKKVGGLLKARDKGLRRK